MGAIEEIAQLRQQGMPDDLLPQMLARRGYKQQEIDAALTSPSTRQAPTSGSTDELQPSIGTAPSATQEYAPYQQEQSADQSYYNQALTTDTIAEIAEQIISERLTKTQQTIDSINSFKSLAESQLQSLNERLKRIELTIDKLQLSLLQRVGEFGAAVEDVKKELVENQKTFKSLVSPSARKQIAKEE